MTFNDYCGNKFAKELIKGFLKRKEFPHAILLTGAKGIGKRTLAKIIAAAIVCTGSNEKPCGKCSSCIKSKKDSHPDIITYKGSDNAKSFHIKEIRSLISDCGILPNDGDKKVYILENSQNMTTQAQNALLKILEEPPGYVTIILTANSQENLLPTIISRSLIIPLEYPGKNESVKCISQKCKKSDEEILTALEISGGNIGKAIEYLEDKKFIQRYEFSLQILDAVCKKNEYELMILTGKFEKEKDLFLKTCEILSTVLSICIEYKAIDEKNPQLKFKDIADKLSFEQINRLILKITELLISYNNFINKNIIYTLFSVKLRSAI
jgi:DNA polymerase III, gamma/tau subunits